MTKGGSDSGRPFCVIWHQPIFPRKIKKNLKKTIVSFDKRKMMRILMIGDADYVL